MKQTYGGTKLANILLLQQMTLEQGRATIKESADILKDIKHSKAVLLTAEQPLVAGASLMKLPAELVQ